MKQVYKIYRDGIDKAVFVGTYVRRSGENFQTFKSRACNFYGLDYGRTSVRKFSVNSKLVKG